VLIINVLFAELAISTCPSSKRLSFIQIGPKCNVFGYLQTTGNIDPTRVFIRWRWHRTVGYFRGLPLDLYPVGVRGLASLASEDRNVQMVNPLSLIKLQFATVGVFEGSKWKIRRAGGTFGWFIVDLVDGMVCVVYCRIAQAVGFRLSTCT
jgi:hypothetical protein